MDTGGISPSGSLDGLPPATGRKRPTDRKNLFSRKRQALRPRAHSVMRRVNAASDSG